MPFKTTARSMQPWADLVSGPIRAFTAISEIETGESTFRRLSRFFVFLLSCILACQPAVKPVPLLSCKHLERFDRTHDILLVDFRPRRRAVAYDGKLELL